jgi:hypothetical protein
MADDGWGRETRTMRTGTAGDRAVTRAAEG